MGLNGFERGMEVVYVPTHVQKRFGLEWKKDIWLELRAWPNLVDEYKVKCDSGFEVGVVSSTNDKFVFVKYWPKLGMAGWEGTQEKATMPGDLIPIKVMSDFHVPLLIER